MNIKSYALLDAAYGPSQQGLPVLEDCEPG